MPKKANKTIWICRDCAGEHFSWSGKCSYCSHWNTLTEFKDQSASLGSSAKIVQPVVLSKISSDAKARLRTKIDEFDLAMGGGIVKGSVLLIGGNPGIGKSTLIWQVAKNLNDTVCYVAAEESSSQIKIRAERLGALSDKILIFEDRNIDNVLISLANIKPSLIIVDSIQTIYDSSVSGTAGNILQIRSCTLKLIDYAKRNSVAVIIIGHVTKDGEVAGPKTLEHLVDGVFYLEGSSSGEERFLRASKNRFGSIDEIGIFEMSEKGMVAKPTFGRLKPSNLLPEGVSRSAVIEGSKVMFIEIQALVQKSNSVISRRNAVGYDLNRLHMLAAIISKVAKIDLSNMDIFLNVSEGYKLKTTMADVACALAIISSYKCKPLAGNKVFIGELDLSGSIHLTSEAKKIIKVSDKSGFIPQLKARDLRDLIRFNF